MSQFLTRMIDASPTLRHLAWRTGRTLYRKARGEPDLNRPEVNGEAYVQRAVIAGTAASERLCALDIGANQGEWSRLLLEQLPPSRRTNEQLRLHAFEPVPATRQSLQRNLSAVSGGSLVHIESCALSDTPGHAEMLIMSESGGTNTLQFDAAMSKSATSTIQIDKATLSEFCAHNKLDALDLVKCDAEGHDPKVIAGAADMLRAGKISVLQFEYNHRWIYARAYLKDVFDLVESLPYRVARVRPHHIETMAAWHPELERYFETNYLLIHDRTLKWFDVLDGRFDASNIYVGARI